MSKSKVQRDPILGQWTMQDVDEMLAELLECDVKVARQMRARWMVTGKSPREELVDLARLLDTEDALCKT